MGVLDSIHTTHNTQTDSAIGNTSNIFSDTNKSQAEDIEKVFSDTKNDREQWHIFRALGDRGWVSFSTTYRGQPLRVKITQASFVDGIFIIEEVIPENKKAMSFEVFQQWINS